MPSFSTSQARTEEISGVPSTIYHPVFLVIFKHFLILVVLAIGVSGAATPTLPECNADFDYANLTVNNSTDNATKVADGELGGQCFSSNSSCNTGLECCRASLSSAVNLCQPGSSGNTTSAGGCLVDNGGCSDVCLTDKDKNSSMCFCSQFGTKLDSSNNKTCVATDLCPDKDFSFLVMSQSASTTKCVTLLDGKVDYTESVFNCLLMGLGPLTLQTQEEMDWLANIRKVRPEFDTNLWLGGQMTESNGESVSWTTEHYSLTRPIFYTNWHKEKPECTVYDGCHMVSNRDNTWSMVHSSDEKGKASQHSYACETIREQHKI